MSEKNIAPITFSDIQAAFDTILLLRDRDVVRLAIATLIGNQMGNRRPIWLMLVSPPSSGKTTILNTLIGMELTLKNGTKINPTVSISDLTENSFASGSVRTDKETSLLYKIPWGGVMIFKDFTSILSKRKESKEVVMGQLREIYDGSYSKKTGTGEDITWKGKVGALAGVTETVYSHLESMSTMGDRFILYQIPQPDRKETLRFKLRQEVTGTTEDIQMPIIQEMVHEYVQQCFNKLQDVKIVLPEDIQNEIIDVADFCTKVRSGIITNSYTGAIEFVPSPEGPARMFEQMLAIASTLILMRKVDGVEGEETLTEADFKMMYKIAYDSIPITRRIGLTYLAQYSQGVDSSALAQKINYPTQVVVSWMEQLNALGVVERMKRQGYGNWWRLRPEYQDIMVRLQGVKVIDASMTEETDIDVVESSWNTLKEQATPVEHVDPDVIQEMINNEEW